ncbi:MAG: hypothetical protein PHP45_04875 [Elusimicrobiales bacterium]|nr:hypothetical protein [Elusimicrobiales bacterium]
MKKLRNAILAALLVLLPPAIAAYGEEPDIYKSPDDGESCSFFAINKSDLKVPVKAPGVEFPDSVFIRERQDIIAFDKLRLEFYNLAGKFSSILEVQGRHCANVEVARDFLLLHEKAFEDRKTLDASRYDEKSVRWVDLQEAPAVPASFKRHERFDDYLENVCRIPKAPQKLQEPVIPDTMPAENKKILASLSETMRTFYDMQLKQQALTEAMMRLEEGFRCREIVQKYYSLRYIQYHDIWGYRSDMLARVAENSIGWKTIP